MVGIPFSTGQAESECVAHRARDHLFFVRANDANRGPAGVRGNHPCILGISRLVQFDAEEAQSIADACADAWRIFADASGEDERVQSPERRSNTEAQARQVLNDIYQDIYGERLLTTSTKQYFADWLARKKDETADGTYIRYRDISNRFLTFLGPERETKDLVFISPKEVMRFRDDLAAKLSGGTVNTALKIMRVVFQQAWKDGYIQENPAAKVDTLKIHEQREVRRPFTLKEAK